MVNLHETVLTYNVKQETIGIGELKHINLAPNLKRETAFKLMFLINSFIWLNS